LNVGIEIGFDSTLCAASQHEFEGPRPCSTPSRGHSSGSRFPCSWCWPSHRCWLSPPPLRST